MPIKQALGESYINKYLLGPKTQINLEEERKKELLEREMPDGTKIMLEDTPFNIARGEEFAAAKRGERMFLPQGESAIDRRLKEREEEMKKLYPSFSDQDVKQILTDAGYDPLNFQFATTPRNFPADISSQPVTGLDQIRDILIQDQKMQNIADAGGVANLAGGGIAGLSGGIDEGHKEDP